MNRNYYRDARLIEEALAADDRPDWALLIDDAIEGGSTAPDILNRIRTTLAQIQSQHLSLPAELDDQIESLARAIDVVLT
jgi:hypothetical protein